MMSIFGSLGLLAFFSFVDIKGAKLLWHWSSSSIVVVHNSLTRLEGLIPIVLPIQHVEFTEANDIEQTGSVQIAKKFEVSLDMPPAALYLKSATASLAGVKDPVP